MEFGEVGPSGFLGSGNGVASSSYSDHAVKQKFCGSADRFNKDEEDCWSNNPAKIAKLSSHSKKHSSSFVFSDDDDHHHHQQQHNMLSFSSPKLDVFAPKKDGVLENKSLQTSTFPYFQHPNSIYSKNAGYSCTGSMNTSMYYMNGVRGPFTPSQWFELEHQALIYKYITANQPIPSNLLIPIRRAFESAGFSTFPGGILRPNTFGWGPFHLGFANSTDPEPGRCRRTDGKKWRCSRDAVPDQKYCERHINRGRHRSRKPVEGHSSRSISGATTIKTNVMNTPSSSSALVVPGGVSSNQLPSSLVNRLTENKANNSRGIQDATGLDFLSPKIGLNSTGNTLSAADQSAAGDFSFLTSDANFSTTQRDSAFSQTYSQSRDLNAQGSNPQHSAHPFVDDRSSILWPKLQTQTERTQLSISIPPADFMSSTSSPTGQGVALSPLRLSRELDPIQTGLGVDTVSNERSPISWENSMGGPLGEVLKTTTSNSSSDQSKSLSALNLLSKGWEGSPQLASSPTGVLHRTALGYFSSSSAGSSPRAENRKALKSGSVCGDHIGFTLGSSFSLPL